MSNKDIRPIFVIHRTGKRRILSNQAQKDQGLTANRLRQNEGKISSVVNRLEYLLGQSPQKKDLLVLARQLCQLCGLELDRLAKRSRDCLICWYCENWAYIEPTFTSMCMMPPRVAFDSRNSGSCSPPEPATQEEAPGSPEPLIYPDLDFEYEDDHFWALPLEASPVQELDEYGCFL